jgi:hypothetical protein
MEHLLEWLFFSDKEISLFQLTFRDYMYENIDIITNERAYELALLGTNTQFQMRILRGRIRGEALMENEIDSNNTWISVLLSYKGLTQYVHDKFIDKFNSYPSEEQMSYMSNAHYSYFTRTPEQMIIDPKAIKLLVKITKC